MTQAHINHAQKTAANPRNSCWVEASAGSGKTKVLTDRVLNLLLNDADPSKILCLTFTKAAAAEMGNRLRDKLSGWTVLSDDDLLQELAALLDDPAEAYLAKARGLFAKFMDTPGGLRIQTIHSFCHALLKKFPLEANIIPHFSVIDEEDQKSLHHKSFVYAMEHCPDQYLQTLTTYLAVDDFQNILAHLLGEKSTLDTWINKYKGLGPFLTHIKKGLGVDVYDSQREILQNFFDRLPDFSALFSLEDTVPEKDLPTLQTLKTCGRDFDIYKGVFLTKKHTIRKKLLYLKNDALQTLMAQEAERVLRTQETLSHFRVYEGTQAVLQFYKYFSKQYEALKIQQNVLDYDDLIQKTKNLLEKSDLQSWVLYKLDGGIDHILVDEAQDTNPDQWGIISALAKEFFTGDSRSETHRTLFVVGDTKQSIYSFQGADPEIFKKVRTLFSDITGSVNHPWKEVDLNMSFRSTPSVLKSVDAVFHESHQLQTTKHSYAKHTAFRKDDAGRVEIWPLVCAEDPDQIAPWTLPEDQKYYKSTRRLLAEQIAKTIQGWIQSKTPLDSKGRPIDPSDIMILVRRRDQFVEEMVRALKRYQIDVTGIDRLVLKDQLPIMDLMAFAEFLLLPDDSLKLATVLKSPLIGLSENDLFDLCHNRPHDSLWQTLKARAETQPQFKTAYDTLNFFLNKVDFLTPYEFFMEVLSTKSYRQKFIERLGAEAEDTLDEFLNTCLDYEQNHTPSMQKFIHWMQTHPLEIKRNLEHSVKGKVRIMTVHGSKGLQASIVFLPDTTNVPQNRNAFLMNPKNHLFLWCPKSDLMTPDLQAYKKFSKELVEYNRLLYVAMTRAEDHLYVCGWQPYRALDPESWYAKIKGAVEPVAKKDADKLIIENPQLRSIAAQQSSKELARPEPAAWVSTPAPAESVVAPINPSKLEEDKNAVFTGPTVHTGVMSAADRGTLIHKILQWILKTTPQDRPQIIQNYLQKFGLPQGEIDPVTTCVLATLKCPDLQPFIKGNYMAELPITAQVDDRPLKGIIDLVHFDFDQKTIAILDYKTGTFDEAYIKHPPEKYARQLEIYKDTLQKIYPDFNIRTYLVWTDGPHVAPVI